MDRGQRIVQFTPAVVERALAALGATKIEPQRGVATACECPRDSVHDLVVHRPAMLRMRMADDRHADSVAERSVNQRLDHSCRPGQCKVLGCRDSIHAGVAFH